MNIVILTPGRAGSALLRDVLTAHTANSNFDKPVIDLVKNLPAVEKQFMSRVAPAYLKSKKVIDNLIDTNVTKSGIPIKLQTLVEKKMIIKNFNECAIVYNEWADENGFPIIKDNQAIVDQAYNELKNWYTEVPNTLKLQ